MKPHLVRVHLSTSVSAVTLSRLREMAEKRNLSLGQVVDLLTAVLARREKP